MAFKAISYIMNLRKFHVSCVQYDFFLDIKSLFCFLCPEFKICTCILKHLRYDCILLYCKLCACACGIHIGMSVCDHSGCTYSSRAGLLFSSSIALHFRALRLCFSLSRFIVLARLSGQRTGKICLILLPNAGVIGSKGMCSF